MKQYFQAAIALQLPNLYRYVLKFIFDIKSMSHDEIYEMQRCLKLWRKKINLDIELERVNPIEKESLEGMENMLLRDSEGGFNFRKRWFKDYNIDYRKFYRLPEAFSPADFARGRQLEIESAKREGTPA